MPPVSRRGAGRMSRARSGCRGKRGKFETEETERSQLVKTTTVGSTAITRDFSILLTRIEDSLTDGDEAEKLVPDGTQHGQNGHSNLEEPKDDHQPIRKEEDKKKPEASKVVGAEKEKGNEEDEDGEFAGGGFYSGMVKRRKKRGNFAAIINDQLERAVAEPEVEAVVELGASPVSKIFKKKGLVEASPFNSDDEENTEMDVVGDTDESPAKCTRAKQPVVQKPQKEQSPDPWRKMFERSTATLRAIRKKAEDYESMLESDSDDVMPKIGETDSRDDERFTALVKFRGRMERYTISMTDKFEKMVAEISERSSVGLTDVILQRKGIEIPTFHTPDSLKCSPFEILEMFLRSEIAEVASASGSSWKKETVSVGRTDLVSLKFQTNDKKRNAVLHVGKKESFRFIKAKVSEALEISKGSQFYLVLDGEKLGDEETPALQDLEDGDCVDVMEVQ